MTQRGERRALRGIAASGGVAVGSAVVVDRRGPPVPRCHVSADATEGEVQRLRDAIEASRDELEQAREGLTEEHQHDYGLILDAHLMMHRDELVVDGAIQMIRREGINAEWALRRVLDSLEGQLKHAGPEYFRERAQDVEQVGQHILRHLSGADEVMPEIRDDSVIVADDLSPADAARLLAAPVQGLVVMLGSATSHTAILARALEIPAVVGVSGVLRRVGAGNVVIVDGLRGEVVVNPDEEERERAEARGDRYRTFTGKLREQRDQPCRTRDDVGVELLANVELPAEAALAATEGAQGIGLYRTEFLYLDRVDAPNEEEQLRIYTDVIRVMNPRPVVLRTFDLGGDKLPLGHRDAPAANPALGLRAIRLSLAHPEMLEVQIRAVLRAAVHGPVQLMFPLVTSVDELREARALVERCCVKLTDEGIEHRRVPLGIMIEVPSAALMADSLAAECDFFSVGTNDLIQYSLALDRGNPDVAHLASPLSPAVLKLLDVTVSAAERHGIPASMCGDMAADPLALPIVIGLGYHKLSVPVAFLGLAREIVRRVEVAEARAAAKAVLACHSTSEVRATVVERFRGVLADLWEEQEIGLGAAG